MTPKPNAERLGWPGSTLIRWKRGPNSKPGCDLTESAFVSRLKLAVVACIGDETHDAVLQALDLEGHGRWEIDLSGRPRWCVTDVDGARVFLAIRDPSMVLVARLPELDRLAPAVGGGTRDRY